MWDDLTFGKKTKEKRKKKKRKISKKKEKGKKIIATKNPSSSLISTHTSRKRYANALSPSLSRKSRSVSFPRFLDARKRAVFLAFFSRATHTARFRASEKAVVGRLPAQKEQKKTTIIANQSVCLRVKSSRRRGHARRVWATRLERNARNECARTRFYRDRFRRSSRNGWVPASVEASSS